MTSRESTGYCFCYISDRALAEWCISICFEEEDPVTRMMWVVKRDVLELTLSRLPSPSFVQLQASWWSLWKSLQLRITWNVFTRQVARSGSPTWQMSAKTNSAEPKRTPDGFCANMDKVEPWPGSRHVCIQRTRTPSLLPSMRNPCVCGPTTTLYKSDSVCKHGIRNLYNILHTSHLDSTLLYQETLRSMC